MAAIAKSMGSAIADALKALVPDAPAEAATSPNTGGGQANEAEEEREPRVIDQSQVGSEIPVVEAKPETPDFINETVALAIPKTKLQGAAMQEEEPAENATAEEAEDDDVTPIYQWDDDYGGMIDRRNVETNEADLLSYEQAYRKRQDAGERMYSRPKGSLIEVEPGRVKDGSVWQADGENMATMVSIIDSYMNGNRDGLPAQGRGQVAQDYIDPFNNLDVLSETMKGAESGLANLRSNVIRYGVGDTDNSQYNLVTSDGTKYDFEDMTDGRLDDYWETFLGSDAPELSFERPESEKDGFGYSGGNWYSYVLDDDGMLMLDQTGMPIIQSVAEFDKSSVSEDGTPVTPAGTVSDDGFYYTLEDGTRVPLRVEDDGSLVPMMMADWNTPAMNPDDAIAWRSYQPLDMGDGTTVPFADVADIMMGNAKKERDYSFTIPLGSGNWKDEAGVSSEPHEITFDFGSLGGLLTPSDEIDITDDEGHLDVGKGFANLPGLVVDAILSTLPYMNPITGIAAMANNAYIASKGLDPQSYDVMTHTYEDPGTMSQDQYAGLMAKTLAEYGLDYALGLGAGAQPLKKALSSWTIPQTPERIAQEATKQMRRNPLARIGRSGAEEGLQEVGSGLFDTVDRGNWLETYFANQLTDENGEKVVDDEGKPVYDTMTSIPDRMRNFADVNIPNFALGGLAGAAMTAPGHTGQWWLDDATLRANGGFMPAAGSSPELSQETWDAMGKSFGDFLDRYRR